MNKPRYNPEPIFDQTDFISWIRYIIKPYKMFGRLTICEDQAEHAIKSVIDNEIRRELEEILRANVSRLDNDR